MTKRELRRAQKLGMVGRLASGMAYEFIQLLSVIRGRAEILTEQLAADESRQRHLEEIRGATVKPSPEKIASRLALLDQRPATAGPFGPLVSFEVVTSRRISVSR